MFVLYKMLGNFPCTCINAAQCTFYFLWPIKKFNILGQYDVCT